MHCARLRRPQDAEGTSLFLYGKRLQQGSVFRHHDSFRPDIVRFNQIKSIFLKLGGVRSEPGARVLNVRAFRIELEFRRVGF